MRYFKSLPFIALCLTVNAGMASSTPATKQGAEQIEAAIVKALQLKKLPANMKLVPEGDHYLFVVDWGKNNNSASRGEKLSVILKYAGEKKWLLSADQPLDMTHESGAETIALQSPRLTFHGQFDEAIKTVTQFQLDMETPHVSYRSSNMAEQRFDMRARRMIITSDMLNLTNASLDSDVKIQFTDFTAPARWVDSSAGHEGDIVNLLFSAQNLNYRFGVTGYRYYDINKLVQFQIDNPTPEKVREHGVELKKRLQAAAPFFDRISGEMSFTNAAIVHNKMIVTANAGSSSFGFTGLLANSAVDAQTQIAGLKIPPALVDSYAVALIPSNIGTRYEISDFNLETPFTLFLGNADFTKENPIDSNNSVFFIGLLGSILPKGYLTINYDITALAPAYQVSSKTSLSYNVLGSIMTGLTNPGGRLAGLTIHSENRLMGYDRIVAALEQAPPHNDLKNILDLMKKAKEIANTDEDGTLAWTLQGMGDKITINGRPLPQSPQPVPAPEQNAPAAP